MRTRERNKNKLIKQTKKVYSTRNTSKVHQKCTLHRLKRQEQCFKTSGRMLMAKSSKNETGRDRSQDRTESHWHCLVSCSNLILF